MISLKNIILIFNYIILIFSPALSLIYGLAILTVNKNNNKHRKVIGVNLAISISLIAASRKYLLHENDDFLSYYNNYLEIFGGNYNVIYEFGDGYEVGLGILNVVISNFFPKLSANGLMFIYSIIITLLFMLYIERKKNKVDYEKYSIYTATCFLFFGYYFATQLTRQFFSGMILLFAISEINNIKKFIYLFLSAIFHSTAIIFYLIIKIYKRAGILPFFILVIITSILLRDLIINLLPDVFLSKLYYHLVDSNDSSEVNYGPLRWVIIVPLIGVLNYYISKINNKKLPDIYEVKITLYLLVMYLILTPFALLPIRMLLLYIFIYMGIALAILMNNLDIKLHRFLILVLIIWKSNNFLFEGDIGQWSAYPLFHYVPLYYISGILY